MRFRPCPSRAGPCSIFQLLCSSCSEFVGFSPHSSSIRTFVEQKSRLASAGPRSLPSRPWITFTIRSGRLTPPPRRRQAPSRSPGNPMPIGRLRHIAGLCGVLGAPALYRFCGVKDTGPRPASGGRRREFAPGPWSGENERAPAARRDLRAEAKTFPRPCPARLIWAGVILRQGRCCCPRSHGIEGKCGRWVPSATAKECGPWGLSPAA
jgi:hypothetical protein